MVVHRVEIETRPGLPDALARETAERLERWSAIPRPSLRTRRVFHLDFDLDEDQASKVATALVDPVVELGGLGALPTVAPHPSAIVTVSFLPGVTDTVGTSVKRAAEDCLGRPLQGAAYTSTMYLFWDLDPRTLEAVAAQVLFNPLIQQIRIEPWPHEPSLAVPRAGSEAAPVVEVIALGGLTRTQLQALSDQRLLALNVEEMEVIAGHFASLGRDPTDAELECLAQTWSEHCKHKIFAAPIDYVDPRGQRQSIPEGLFRRYIRGATESIAARRIERGTDPSEAPFLVSVFHDNAGVVRFSAHDHLVYKVETHNSPSALDPYGGALTGIVGVNRDTFGTGVGADLLANVWGYCFGPPDYAEPLPAGLMAPRRVRAGVHRGVSDGGNQSGIPYARGWELFDRRFVGKPLVFCGTVGVMPQVVAGHPTHRKRTAVGDKIVMVGGRIGKDGIHGATFSSAELVEQTPVQVVQLGDPITQKMMFDMLAEARDAGLYSGMTDNGAGGLSSSVGEMATLTGGARIDLAHAPLKYPGLAPWEILISEAQERMTLSVAPDRIEEFLALARRREVEATVLGEFTDTGRFEVTYGDRVVLDLTLEFLHDGVPLPTLTARWEPPEQPWASPAAVARSLREVPAGASLMTLLATPELGSGEALARQYDHEVKGLSVVKPWVGSHQDVPATATVMRARHMRNEGVVLGEGIHPFFSDMDTLAMAHACVDEGVRRVLCAGARIDRMAALDNFCWPDPIESSKTPDGPHKLAQLVRCCEGLRQACEALDVPLISGKDSMKNDAILGGVKISVPPTLLVSVMGQLEDVRNALSLEPRAVGDAVYLLGDTRRELGGSSWARVQGLQLQEAPATDLARNMARYRAFVQARDAGLIRSAHVLSRGGLALALAHLALASDLGLDCCLDDFASDLEPTVILFSESTGRMLVTVDPSQAPDLENRLGSHGMIRLGHIARPKSGRGWLRVERDGEPVLDLDTEGMRAAFSGGTFA